LYLVLELVLSGTDTCTCIYMPSTGILIMPRNQYHTLRGSGNTIVTMTSKVNGKNMEILNQQKRPHN